MQTLSTTTFVGQALIREIKKKYPNWRFVFTPKQDYEGIVSDARGDASDNIITRTSFPLFAYNRSNLRPTELGQRGNRFTTYAAQPHVGTSDISTYRIAHCEFDFNFTLIDKDISTIESFEIDFLSKEGLGRITEIDVDFTSAGIGVLKYYVTWNVNLNNFDLNTDANSYTSISGAARILGWFVSLYGDSPIISSIGLGLKTRFHELEEIKIT